MTTGKITQVIGTVVDAEFPSDEMPAIYNALETEVKGQSLVLEVEQHVGNNRVRCLALGPTDGLTRGVQVTDTGAPISVPVGDKTLGRLFNCLGDTLDKLGQVDSEIRWPIHREPPTLEEQATTVEVLETGIKVMDLITPFTRGGKVGAYGGAGTGKKMGENEDDSSALATNFSSSNTGGNTNSAARQVGIRDLLCFVKRIKSLTFLPLFTEQQRYTLLRHATGSFFAHIGSIPARKHCVELFGELIWELPRSMTKLMLDEKPQIDLCEGESLSIGGEYLNLVP